MNVSAKTEYASIAMLELAVNYGSGEPVRIRRIAEAHGIPPRFLVQILLQLKGAGLVASTRGASGGYQLVRDPKDVSLGEIMDVAEGGNKELTSSAGVETPASRVLMDSWRGIADLERLRLASISLAQLVERVRGEGDSMFYI
jgi:Rrf2 family protein